MSSFLEPDLRLFKKFQLFTKEWSKIIKKINVKTKKLNDLEKIV